MTQESVRSLATECLRAIADDLARTKTIASDDTGLIPRRSALIAPIDSSVWSLVDIARADEDRMDVIYRGGGPPADEVIVSWIAPQNTLTPLRMRIVDMAQLPSLNWRLTLEPIAIAAGAPHDTTPVNTAP